MTDEPIDADHITWPPFSLSTATPRFLFISSADGTQLGRYRWDERTETWWPLDEEEDDDQVEMTEQ